MLSGEPGYPVRGVSLRGNSMAPATQVRIGGGAQLQQPSVTGADRRFSLEPADIGRDVGNGLSRRQIVAIRNALHTRVPATVVAIVEELLAQNRGMLTGDARHLPVARASAVGSVAHGAGVKDFHPVSEIRGALPNRL